MAFLALNIEQETCPLTTIIEFCSLLEGFYLPSWNASQSWETGDAFFLIRATANGDGGQLRVVILVHGYRCST
jgi:hypothetical protein